MNERKMTPQKRNSYDSLLRSILGHFPSFLRRYSRFCVVGYRLNHNLTEKRNFENNVDLFRFLKRGYSDCMKEVMENTRHRGRMITNNWQIIDNLFANFQKKVAF